MKGKKSFILYADYIHTFKILNDEKAGKLIKTILSYVNDENPQCTDQVIEVAFEPIKQQLKRDLKGWEDKKSKRVVFPSKLEKKYNELIKEGYNLEMVLAAMKNAKQDKFHKENNYRYCTLEYFSRVKTLDKYYYISENKKDNKYIPTL